MTHKQVAALLDWMTAVVVGLVFGMLFALSI